LSFRPLGAAMGGIIRGWLEDPAARRQVLERTWRRALGDAVGGRSRPLGFEDGVLTVEVTDPAWAPELKAMSGELIAKMNAALGQRWITRIEWVQPPDGEDSRSDRGPE